MDRHVYSCRAWDSITRIGGRSARTFRGLSELDLSSSPVNPGLVQGSGYKTT